VSLEPGAGHLMFLCTRHGRVARHSAILNRIQDESVDLLVMGGYGHSRLRDFVLGGVTRGILATMTVPVLLSH
jgi:nucleotide-binding universal stress UspA family protein